MFRIAVLLCVVAAAAAGGKNCCSAGDQQRVKDSWNQLWNNADSSTTKTIFGREVFRRFFVIYPDTTELFNRVNVADRNSPEFSGHMVRVLTGLDLSINMLSESDVLTAELEHLNEQHLARDGLKQEYFTTMVDILHETLPQVLDDYDGLSFKNCLNNIVGVITKNLP